MTDFGRRYERSSGSAAWVVAESGTTCLPSEWKRESVLDSMGTGRRPRPGVAAGVMLEAHARGPWVAAARPPGPWAWSRASHAESATIPVWTRLNRKPE